MGSSRAKNKLAWGWGDLAGPPAAHVMFGLGLFPHLHCQGWDLCCGSPAPASSIMDGQVLWAMELSFGLLFLLICEAQDALSPFLVQAPEQG